MNKTALFSVRKYFIVSALIHQANMNRSQPRSIPLTLKSEEPSDSSPPHSSAHILISSSQQGLIRSSSSRKPYVIQSLPSYSFTVIWEMSLRSAGKLLKLYENLGPSRSVHPQIGRDNGGSQRAKRFCKPRFD